jgi:uncharacterized membrane protein YphA (DoxX/SURF4 family)
MRRISCIIIGLLFVFSGFVKAVDPVGTGLIFSEYFNAFGLHFPGSFGLVAGVMLSTLEFLLGVMLLLDFRKNLTAWGTFLLMSFFTVLTLFLALFNPVSDCGCFGEAIKLSNWETFIKNIIFWPFTLFLFIGRNRTAPLAREWVEYLVGALFALFAAGISFYSYRHLPLMEFMAFRAGNNVAEILDNARNDPGITFETELVYSKNGREALFSIDDLPDSTWTFVDSRTREISSGIRHKITDFTVRDEEGRNVGDSLLAIKPAALVLLVTTEQRLNNKTLDPVKPLLAECINGERPFYVISSVAPSVILSALEQAGLQMPVYYADIKTLLTMIRSTPGLMVLQDGVVNAKYAWRDFPSSEEWIRLINTDPELVVAQSRIHNRLRIEILALTVFLVIFLLRKGFWFSRRHM